VDDITVNRLYSVFVEMDRDGVGTIDLQEMISFLKLEATPFTDRVFHLFGATLLPSWPIFFCILPTLADATADGQIDFTEFVNAVWMFCPLDIKSLISFAFKLYEPVSMTPHGPRGQGHLSIVRLVTRRHIPGRMQFASRFAQEDVKLMLEEVYGKMTNLNSRLAPLYEDLDSNDDQRVNLAEFKSMNDKYSSLLFPAFRMQLRLRQSILGEPFWEEQMRRRIREGEVSNESMWEIMRELDAQRRKANRGVMHEMAKGRWVPTDLPRDTYIPAPGLTFKARSNPHLAQRELLIRAGVIKVKPSAALKAKLDEQAQRLLDKRPRRSTRISTRPTAPLAAATQAPVSEKREEKPEFARRAALDNELNRAMARAKRR
jgi:hypothetical protein